MGALGTIDHHRPKHSHPAEVLSWANLYHCCQECQKGWGLPYSDLVLRPDAPGFNFHDHFVYDGSTGRIAATPGDDNAQRRAEATIAFFGWNEADRPKLRRRIVNRSRRVLSRDPGEPIDDHPFRFAYLGYRHD